MKYRNIQFTLINFLLAFTFVVVFFPIQALAEELENVELTIMHMNDTHAHLDTMPQMKTAIDEERGKVNNSLLLHAGDAFSGTLYFTEFKGQADVAMLNMLGLDAMVYGNHEFDLGMKENGHASLAEFVKQAHFPLLGTNVNFSNDPFMNELVDATPLVEDPVGGTSYHSIVKNIDGEKVGIFGLTTEDTYAISTPMSVQFINYYATAEEAVRKFKEAGINKIIALTHLGYDSHPAAGNDLLLAQVDGIDVIVGGHTHSALNEPTLIELEGQEPTVIVQAGQYTQQLGILNVTFDADGVIIKHDGKLISVQDKVADPQVSEELKPYRDKIEELMGTSTGAVAVKNIPNPRFEDGNEDSVRANETEIGNLITDAMLAMAKEKFPETVIALQNGGGIRAPIAAGEITIGHVISVLPFGNDPVIAKVTGQELKEILEHSVRYSPEENGAFLHVSGMRYSYDSGEKPGNRVLTMEINNNGTFVPIKLEEEYIITTHQFLARGGDGFDTFKKIYEDGRVTNIGEIDWEQLLNYMVDERYLNGVVNPVREGRIIDVARGELPNEKEPEEPTKPEVMEITFGETIEIFASKLLKVKGTSISILLPENLPAGTKITVTEVKEGRPANSAGDIVDIDVQLPEGHQDFQGEFVLTLGVDEHSVDKEVAIFYFNEGTGKWENRGGIRSEDKQSIAIEVSHFSIYGVLLTNTGAETNDTGDTDGRDEAGSTNGVSGTNGTNNTVENETSETSDSEKTSTTGKKLPKTATSIYTTLFVGIFILAVGFGFMYLEKLYGTKE